MDEDLLAMTFLGDIWTELPKQIYKTKEQNT